MAELPPPSVPTQERTLKVREQERSFLSSFNRADTKLARVTSAWVASWLDMPVA
jgi:hypothetical protein